ncbi:MAG: hypothetical protein L3J79_05005 [Candidatus Marinimicrobia bacterium]|nr:hypothetical protein [Candidatus Neomarinimicrobiota bacterium]
MSSDEYDANNNQLTQTDPRGNRVEFTYDELNRKKQHIQQKTTGNLTVSYDIYDAEGNLTRLTDAKGQLFGYEYDALNRLTTTNYPLVVTPFLTIQETTTGYDANNNIETITETKQNTSGGTQTDSTLNIWDTFDRLTSSTQRGIAISYAYDNNGNRTSVSTVNGSTSYTFDHRNRLKTAVVGTDTTTYSYTPDGLTETISYPNGTSATYTYWPTNRVETINHKDNAAATISSFSYTYDSNGNRKQQIEEQNGLVETTTYRYDDLDRMLRFSLSNGTTERTTVYSFEGYNRKTEWVTENGTTIVSRSYSYDETNWLTGTIDRADPINPISISYQYDNNGNTILKTDSSKPGEDLVFDYDVANRLVQTTQSATILGQYDYNVQGMRVRHYGSERGDVDSFYDDGSVLEEYVSGAGGGLLAHYRYGDRLLSLDAPNDGGVQYYHHDALGSTVNLTDSTGNTKVSYSLDPWGHIRNQIGTSVNRQIFTGQELDEQTGLIYFGARYYDPDVGRFISQDSYLGESGTPPSLHRYLYAYSNPTTFVDPDGHFVVSGTVALTYFAWKAFESAIETGVEAGIAEYSDDKEFSVGLTFAKNMLVNSTIGLVPGVTEAKIGTKTAIYGGKLALRTAADSAVDAATREGNFVDHLGRNLVANLGGDVVGIAARRGGKKLSTKVTTEVQGESEALDSISKVGLDSRKGTAALQEKYGHLTTGQRRARIDELSESIYQRKLDTDLANQKYVFRAVEADNLQYYDEGISGPLGSPAYFSLEGGEAALEHMSRTQMKDKPDILLRIPVSEIKNPVIARPYGYTPESMRPTQYGWEYNVNSYPEYGQGGYRQFLGTTEKYDPSWIYKDWRK